MTSLDVDELASALPSVAASRQGGQWRARLLRSVPQQGSGTAPYAAGSFLSLPFNDMVVLIEEDFLKAVRAAAGCHLQPACQAGPALLDVLKTALGMEGGYGTWDQLMCVRIGDSWSSREPSLIWMDDKVEQVGTVEALCGRAWHLPLYAHAARRDKPAVEAFREAFRGCAERQEPVVIKPRHGANSKSIFVWSAPHETGEEEIMESFVVAASSHDLSYNKECWQLSQVPKEAILQPLYRTLVPPGGAQGSRAAPLELKLQTLFGHVVGGTLNTHPQLLWVCRSGAIQFWDADELSERGHVRCRNIDKLYGRELPDVAVEVLQGVLKHHWASIRETSECLARSAGLDELRIDWLLGDVTWGPRIGELTYMGAGSRITPPLSARLARAFAAGHLLRAGALLIAEGAEERVPCLWPLATENPNLQPGRRGPAQRKRDEPRGRRRTQRCAGQE